MQQLPIYFSQNFYIEGREAESGGRNFMLKIFVEGRCVLAQEDPDEMGARWWFYGVNPGGIAGSGSTADEARFDFYDRVQSTLVDLAGESQSLEEFEASVQTFVSDTSEAELRDWLSAREEVRAGRAEAVGLRRVTTDKEPKCAVELLINQTEQRVASVEHASYGALPLDAANDNYSLAAAA